jgi:hypothetical protein
MFDLPRRLRVALFVLVAVAAVAPALVRDRFAQDPHYHNFADRRRWATIPNFGDVASNLPFLAVGIYGLAAARRARDPLAYGVLFLGVLFTAFGSTWYHLSPTTDRLLWDRLPMSVGFMGLLSATVSERVGPRLGRMLLWPLVCLGLFSVAYWHWTERRSCGDLRPYYAVQFSSLLLVLVSVILFRSPYTRSGDILSAIAIYALAKVCESNDLRLLLAGGVSGHTIKHLLAAVSVYLLARMLVLREGRPPVALRRLPLPAR